MEVYSGTPSGEERLGGVAEPDSVARPGTSVPIMMKRPPDRLHMPKQPTNESSLLEMAMSGEYPIPRRMPLKHHLSQPLLPHSYSSQSQSLRLSYGKTPWSHIVHQSAAGTYESIGPNWKSLCKPACLPLTTDVFPSPEELNERYTQKPYTITSIDDDQDLDDAAFNCHLEGVLKELVSQRLTLGFQLVQQASSLGTEGSTYSGLISKGTSGSRYIVGLSSSYHTLSVDPGDHNIEIKRYIRQESNHGPVLPVEYVYRLWPARGQGYQNMHATLSHSPIEGLNWNFIDQVILGHIHKEPISLMAGLKFWRTRFVLIPADNAERDKSEADVMNTEQERVLNFEKFKGLIQKMAKFDLPDIPVLPFKATVSSFTQARESTRTSTSGTDSLLTAHSPLADIMAAAQQPGSGLVIGTRRWHLRKHPHCFVGQQFVSWIMQKVGKVRNRDEACALAKKMLNENFIECTTTKCSAFVDGYAFYRFRDEKSASQPYLKSRQDSWAANLGNDKPLKLSECVVYTTKLANKDRATWIVLHFDAHYNPLRPFHLEYHWMVSTGNAMEELLQQFHRKARSCKLLFIPLPIQPIRRYEGTDNPLMAPIFVPLAISFPWAAEPKDGESDTDQVEEGGGEASKYQFLCSVLQGLGFMTDMDADHRVSANFGGRPVEYTYIRPVYQYTQWVHKGGAALVEVVDGEDDEGFLFVENTLLAGRWRAFGQTGNEWSAPHLLQQLREFCADVDRLTDLWRSLSSKSSDTLSEKGIDADLSDSETIDNVTTN